MIILGCTTTFAPKSYSEKLDAFVNVNYDRKRMVVLSSDSFDSKWLHFSAGYNCCNPGYTSCNPDAIFIRPNFWFTRDWAATLPSHWAQQVLGHNLLLGLSSHLSTALSHTHPVSTRPIQRRNLQTSLASFAPPLPCLLLFLSHEFDDCAYSVLRPPLFS